VLGITIPLQIQISGYIYPMEYNQKESYIYRASYNADANKEMFGILAGLTDKARRRECGSYFGSLWGILDHLVTAEYVWLNRFKPLLEDSDFFRDPELSPDNLSWFEDLCPGFEELGERSAYISGKLTEWFRVYPREGYGKPFQYRDSKGATRDAVAGPSFDYLLIHQLHHRGQISQILDVAGLPNNFADNLRFLEPGGSNS